MKQQTALDYFIEHLQRMGNKREENNKYHIVIDTNDYLLLKNQSKDIENRAPQIRNIKTEKLIDQQLLEQEIIKMHRYIDELFDGLFQKNTSKEFIYQNNMNGILIKEIAELRLRIAQLENS